MHGVQQLAMHVFLSCIIVVVNAHRHHHKHCSESEKRSVSIETRSVQEIYEAALAEQAELGNNGPLIIYSGGTGRGQLDGTAKAFEQRFPNLTAKIIVDYSTFHGPRVDIQLANNSLIPDLIQLQTLQDFPRWKQQGVLMQYKPANWSKVYPKYRDPQGYYTATFILLFNTLVNSQRLPAREEWPKTARDLLKPEFGEGKIVVVHPIMDDAILFYFKQVVDKYGYDYLVKFAAQNPLFVCNGGVQLTMVSNGTAAVGPAGIGSIPFGNDSPIQMAQFPPANNDPFTIYAMYMSIFKKTKRPEAVKLFLNWMLEKENANNVGNIWSVRTDVPPKQEFKQIWKYKNSNHQAFARFMAEYEPRERFRKQAELLLGEAKCDQSSIESSVNVS